MAIGTFIIEFLKATMWPITTFSILLLFRKPILKILGSLKTLEGWGVKASLEDQKKILIEETKAGMDSVLESLEKLEQIDSGSGKIQNLAVNIGNTITRDCMMTFATNASKPLNLKYNLYYDPNNREDSIDANYLGMYAEKTIYAVGMLKKIVYCDLIGEELISSNENHGGFASLTTEERMRIEGIIRENDAHYPGKIAEGMKFYLVDNFYETDFKKSSPNSLRSKKYFWLRDYIESFHDGMSTEKVAIILRSKTWK